MRTVFLFCFGFLALAAADDLQEEQGIQTLSETCCLLTHDELRRLFENDDPSVFNSGISHQLGDDAPNLAELTAMFNTLNDGTVPDYITNHGLTVISNFTGTYTYSNANLGTFTSVNYGLVQSDVTTGTYTSLMFNSIQGTFGTISNTVGSALFSRVGYSKDATSVAWQGGTEGVFLYKMPTGSYAAYGNYTGGTQGISVSNSGAEPETSLNTLGIMNTYSYSSKTVTNMNARSQSGHYSATADMFSVTGGSNATVSMYGTIPAEGNEMHGTSNGTVFNVDKQATMQSTSAGYISIDRTDPFGEGNLPNYFNGMYTTVGLYLP